MLAPVEIVIHGRYRNAPKAIATGIASGAAGSSSEPMVEAPGGEP